MGLLRGIKTTAVLLSFYIAVAYFLGPGINMTPESFKSKEAPEFHGPLTANKLLDSSERQFEGIIGEGPESIVVKENILFTGVRGGRIQQINGNQIKTITRIGGSNCKVLGSGNDECGRPLGIRLNKKGELVVADSAKGLYTVSLKDGQVTTLVSSSEKIEGKRLGFADDLAIAANGDIFFSDATYKWNFAEFLLDMIESAGNGRILHYNAQTKNVTVLVEDLHFANGVELSPDEDYLLYAESGRGNIFKYHLKGNKKGQVEHFHENLPGHPDNIRRSPRNTYWVALFAVRLPHEDYNYDWFSEYPTIRTVYYSTLYFTIQLVNKLKTQYPSSLADIIHEKLSQWLSNVLYNSHYGLVLELDSNGKIIRSLHSPSGVVNKISQVTEHDNILYIASYENDFFAKYKL